VLTPCSTGRHSDGFNRAHRQRSISGRTFAARRCRDTAAEPDAYQRAAGRGRCLRCTAVVFSPPSSGQHGAVAEWRVVVVRNGADVRCSRRVQPMWTASSHRPMQTTTMRPQSHCSCRCGTSCVFTTIGTLQTGIGRSICGGSTNRRAGHGLMRHVVGCAPGNAKGLRLSKAAQRHGRPGQCDGPGATSCSSTASARTASAARPTTPTSTSARTSSTPTRASRVWRASLSRIVFGVTS
jgi:hypothetical protein